MTEKHIREEERGGKRGEKRGKERRKEEEEGEGAASAIKVNASCEC